MDICFDLAGVVAQILTEAASQSGLAGGDFVPDVRPADPVHGDFQANGVLAYAKRHRQNPRVVADGLVGQLGGLGSQFDIAVAGPGFINFKLKPAALLAWLDVSRPGSAGRRRRVHRAGPYRGGGLQLAQHRQADARRPSSLRRDR